jgi:hypothetical protein
LQLITIQSVKDLTQSAGVKIQKPLILLHRTGLVKTIGSYHHPVLYARLYYKKYHSNLILNATIVNFINFPKTPLFPLPGTMTECIYIKCRLSVINSLKFPKLKQLVRTTTHRYMQGYTKVFLRQSKWHFSGTVMVIGTLLGFIA